MKDIREADWKRLRDLKPIALDRFCARVLSDIERASSDSAATSHQRYDGLSRSNAVGKLLLMHQASLLTEDEVAAFSEDIRNAVARSSDA